MNKYLLLALCISLPFVFAPLPEILSPEPAASAVPTPPVVVSDSLMSLARPVANAYIKALDQTLWSEELSAWLAETAYHGSVDTFRSTDFDRWEFEKSCFETDTVLNGCTSKYSFYDDGNFLEPKAILQQVFIAEQPVKPAVQLSAAVWDLISHRLTQEFGASDTVPRDHLLTPFDLGSVDNEREPLFWKDGRKRIILAEYTNYIVILARELALDSLLHHNQEVEGRYAATIDGDALRSELCDSLAGTDTPISGMCSSRATPTQRLAEIVNWGKFVFAAERLGDSTHLPLYHMALYAFGSTYSPPQQPGSSIPWDIDTLKRYSVFFEWVHIGEFWEYSHAPLTELWSRYPGTHWGQLAFVILQNLGWCLDGMCNGNNGPLVASKGEEFLKSYPESRYTPEILLTVAKGYETNWNVSTCDPENSPYMGDEKLSNDEPSRQKSIAYYERILKEYPNSLEAGVARVRLPRLKLGINTDQRDFMFIYD